MDFRQQFLEQRNKKNMEEAEDVDVNAAIHGMSDQILDFGAHSDKPQAD